MPEKPAYCDRDESDDEDDAAVRRARDCQHQKRQHLVAHQTGFAVSADLRGTAAIGGQPAEIVASLAGTFVLHCRCYVDGAEVVMTERETW